jgi:hypothetical protein
MQIVQISGVVDSGDSISQDTYTITEVVLDDIFDGTPKERSIDDVIATYARDKIV